MMLKDWPDFFPSRRDTYSWRVGFHRRDVEVVSVRRDDSSRPSQLTSAPDANWRS
jgi:hypothetical protein